MGGNYQHPENRDIQTQKGKHRKKLEMQKQPGLCTEIRNTGREREVNDVAKLAHWETAWPCRVLPVLLQRSLAPEHSIWEMLLWK